MDRPATNYLKSALLSLVVSLLIATGCKTTGNDPRSYPLQAKIIRTVA